MMWNWIKEHPQRICGLLLVIFTQVQAAFALLQAPLPPLAAWGVNTTIGVVVAALAWGMKNFKDKEPYSPTETPK